MSILLYLLVGANFRTKMQIRFNMPKESLICRTAVGGKMFVWVAMIVTTINRLIGTENGRARSIRRRFSG